MKHPILKVLSNGSFTYLLLSELFSQIAINLLNFVLLILVYNMVRSSIAVAGVILAFTVPALLFGVLAGIYVDRWNKKHVLFYTNLLRAVLVFPLFFLNTDLFSIYTLTFLVSLVTQFFIPAEAPIIPLIVEKRLLLSANALFSMGIFASILIAYAISGPFLIFFGESNGFIAITVLFIISSVFAYFIKTRKSTIVLSNSVDVQTLRIDIKKTIKLLSKIKKVTNALLLLTLLQTVVLSIAVAGPGFAENILKIKVEEFPILFVAPSVLGIGLCAFVLGNFFHKASKKTMVRLGLFLIGISLTISPFILSFVSTSRIIYAAITLAFVMGIAFALIFIPSNTVVQEETSDQMRGKVYGLLNALVGGVSIMPVLMVGTISDIFGVDKVLFVMGITILLISQIRWGLK